MAVIEVFHNYFYGFLLPPPSHHDLFQILPVFPYLLVYFLIAQITSTDLSIPLSRDAVFTFPSIDLQNFQGLLLQYYNFFYYLINTQYFPPYLAL